jgi:uncharacterized membrane protein
MHLGKKGQSAGVIGLGVAAVAMMIVFLIAAKVYDALPTDITGTANTTLFTNALAVLSNMSLMPIIILVGAAILVIGTLLTIRAR